MTILPIRPADERIDQYGNVIEPRFPVTIGVELTVSGRNLAHVKRTAAERALLAAELHLNRTKLVSPTIRQCAALGRVSVPYVAAAISIADDNAARTAVLRGDCTVLDATKADTPESLAEHFARTTPAEWLEAARTVGPAIVWERMVAPLV